MLPLSFFGIRVAPLHLKQGVELHKKVQEMSQEKLS